MIQLNAEKYKFSSRRNYITPPDSIFLSKTAVNCSIEFQPSREIQDSLHVVHK
jgi:hypothetical protein